VATILVVFGALLTVSRVSSAKAQRPVASAKCGPSVPGAAAPNGQSETISQQNGRTVRNHWGDGQQAPAGCSSDAVQTAANNAQTVNCPTVADKLPKVPAAAKSEVDQQLAQLDTQIADANNRLATGKGQGGQAANNQAANNQAANNQAANNQAANNQAANNNANNANNANAILSQLNSKRTAAIDRIATAIGRVAAKPNNLNSLATCTLKAANNGGNANGGKNNGGANNGGANNGGNANGGKVNDPNNLGILANSCQGGSKLQPHDGFQNGNRCVGTQMGEVGDAAKNPSLLITQFPQQVQANQPFTLRVSTRNLIRDRFLAAGKGGYYVEMSLLNAQGLVRGHFHTACRMLDSTQVAPDPAPPPAFFVATEDGGGSANADQIEIRVPGLPSKGTAQCMSWAGDGSHRVPMMQRANEPVAVDAVRITVN
jgi:hypothetical protein